MERLSQPAQNGISSSISADLPAPASAGLRPRNARAGGAEVVAAVRGAGAARIEHGELRIEALQHDFGRVALVAVFVRPFARLQRAFEVDLRALLEILLDDLAQTFVEDDDAMPLGFFLRSPVALSRQLSEVATRKFAIGRPSWVRRISGSAPRLPMRITLLTLPAMMLSAWRSAVARSRCQVAAARR